MPTSATPLYGFPHLLGNSNGKDIKTVSKALAEKLEATLKNKNMPPLDSDLVALLARLAAVEDAQDDFLTDSGWQTVTTGTGWSPVAGYAPRVRAIGKRVEAIGAVTLGAGGSWSNVLTAPAGYRSAENAFAGLFAASQAGVAGMFHAAPTGILSVSYPAGTSANGMVVPIVASWYRA